MKVHLISNLAGASDESLPTLLREIGESRPDYFQVREKQLSDRSLADLVKRVRAALPPSTAILVNGRPDVAVAAGAAGVQLPSDGLDAAQVRRHFPAPFLIGVSCHAIEELFRAADAEADFAVLGPLYPPKSKTSTFPELGPEVLDSLDAPPLPIHALGGIDVRRLASWPLERRRKVAGVAGISLMSAGPGAIAALRAIPGAMDS
ncbi:MAG: thiamine phosphate synthase [Thermoanaerobaculia bacterium]